MQSPLTLMSGILYYHYNQYQIATLLYYIDYKASNELFNFIDKMSCFGQMWRRE